MSFFSSVLNFLDDTLHILRFIEYLVIDLRKRQCTVITECLQGTGRDVQIPAYVLIVHPLVQRPVVLPVANFHDPMLKVFKLTHQFFKQLSIPTNSILFPFLLIDVYSFLVVCDKEKPYILKGNGFRLTGSMWR